MKTICQPHLGVFFGSGLVDHPLTVMEDLRLDTAMVHSPSAWPRWEGSGAIPLFFNDAAVGPAQTAMIIRQLASVQGRRVGFFCYAGLNRSAFVCGLWLWLREGFTGGSELVDLLRDCRQDPHCLHNPVFASILVDLGRPLMPERQVIEGYR